MADETIPAWLDGRLTPIDKIEVHRRGLRHPAVSVFLRVGEDILFQRRAAQKYHSGLLWANSCCTHPRWGEAAVACAGRRMQEELGISGLAFSPLGQVEYRAAVTGRETGLVEHEVVDVFLAELPRRPPLAPDPAEVAETRWASLPEFDAFMARNPEAVTPWLKLYLGAHRDTLFGRHAGAASEAASPPGQVAGR